MARARQGTLSGSAVFSSATWARAESEVRGRAWLADGRGSQNSGPLNPTDIPCFQAAIRRIHSVALLWACMYLGVYRLTHMVSLLGGSLGSLPCP